MNRKENNLYCDEQNVFYPDRSCVDNIYPLKAVPRNRKYSKIVTIN